MCFTERSSSSSSASSRSSSGRSNDSASVARRARNHASVARQEVRKAGIKAGSEKRVRVDRHPPARRDRVELETIRDAVVRVAATSSATSPVKRGLQYICNNFIPALLSPTKSPAARRMMDFARRLRGPPLPALLFHKAPDAEAAAAASTGSQSSKESLAGLRPLLSPSSPLQFFDILSSSDSDEADDEAGSDSSFSSTGTPTPVGRRNVEATATVEAAAAVEEPDEAEDVPPRITRVKVEEPVSPVVPKERPIEKIIRWSFGVERRLKDADGWKTFIQLFLPADDTGRRIPRVASRFRPYARPVVNRTHRFAVTDDCAVLERFANSEDMCVACYAQYALAWSVIDEGYRGSYTFKTIPWPMFITPNSLEDVTKERVWEFIRYAKRPPGLTALHSFPRRYKGVALQEILDHWRRDKFVNRIILHMEDIEDQFRAFVASYIVLKALGDLVEGRAR